MGIRGESGKRQRGREKGPIKGVLSSVYHWGQVALTPIGEPFEEHIECISDLSSKDQEAGSYPLSPFPIGWGEINLTTLPGLGTLGLSEL